MNFKIKTIFLSIGLTINELKKSFFLNYVLLLITLGLIYLFSIILLGFYNQINNTNAIYFIILFALFLIITLISIFIVLYKIKKITLFKVINIVMHSKDNKLLSFLENTLDKEFKFDSKKNIKKLIRFITTIIFLLLLSALILGAIIIISNLMLKIIVVLISLLFFGPFVVFLILYSFYVYSLKELVLSYTTFVDYFEILLIAFIINIIPIAILNLLYLLFSSNTIVIHILLFLFIFIVCFSFYFDFCLFSYIYLQEKSKN